MVRTERAADPENTTVACMTGQGQMRKIDRCIAKGIVAPTAAIAYSWPRCQMGPKECIGFPPIRAAAE